jgi:hypothetical protein
MTIPMLPIRSRFHADSVSDRDVLAFNATV